MGDVEYRPVAETVGDAAPDRGAQDGADARGQQDDRGFPESQVPGLDDEGRLKWLENLELSVFIDADAGTWHSLEKILPVMAITAPGTFCDVTLLNRVDAVTRFRAAHGLCLFIRQGQEQQYRLFVQHASLDYRIMRAQQRRRGIIEND